MAFGLKTTIEGNSAGDTLFFIQGWPDDMTLWDAQVEALSPDHRCVRVNMPNYGGERKIRWGHTTDEIVEALAGCIRQVSPGSPVTLIIHDWGSYWGHIMHKRHPELVSRIASLDVAPQVEPGPLAALGIIFYQWWLAIAFFVGGALGDWMTRAMASALGAPLARNRITAWMNYPYRNVWADIFSGRMRSNNRGYWPEIPLLFVYGTNKPFNFHSRKWEEHVTSTGGKVVALNVGHWVHKDPALTGILVDWLNGSD